MAGWLVACCLLLLSGCSPRASAAPGELATAQVICPGRASYHPTLRLLRGIPDVTLFIQPHDGKRVISRAILDTGNDVVFRQC